MNGYYESIRRYTEIMDGSVPAMRMDCKTAGEYAVWKEKARNKLYFLLGLERMKWTEPNPELLSLSLIHI